MLASPIISTDGAPHVLASAKDLALPPVFGILGIFLLFFIVGILGIFHWNCRDAHLLPLSAPGRKRERKTFSKLSFSRLETPLPWHDEMSQQTWNSSNLLHQ